MQCSLSPAMLHTCVRTRVVVNLPTNRNRGQEALLNLPNLWTHTPDSLLSLEDLANREKRGLHVQLSRLCACEREKTDTMGNEWTLHYATRLHEPWQWRRSP